jgi:ribose transport system substrate-binding protein
MKDKMNRRQFLTTAGLAAAGAAMYSPNVFAMDLPSVDMPLVRRADQKMFKVSYIPKALNNPVFDLSKRGAEDAGKELGFEVTWDGPVKSDAAEQVRVMEDVIARKADGIAVSCNDPATLKPAIDKAIDKGIKVITWDADAPDSKRIFNYSVNQYDNGLKGGEMLAKLLNGKGNVSYLTGVPGAFNLEERIRGFKDALAKYPDMKIVATDACDDDINKAVDQVEARLRAMPDLDGMFFIGMWPLFADPKALPTMIKAATSGKTKIVSVDNLRDALVYLQQGYVHGLIGYSWYGYGYNSAKALYALLSGHFMASNYNLDKSNIEAEMKKWEDTKGAY